jgi:putative SOS response-associated peptidase YedK
MCSRITAYQSVRARRLMMELLGESGARLRDNPQEAEPAENDSPDAEPTSGLGDSLPVIFEDGGKRQVETMDWGLVPHWAREAEAARPDFPRPVNARAETLVTNRYFKVPVESRRCIVLMDGFVEYRRARGRKHPYHVRRKDQEPFIVAGLWDFSLERGLQRRTFTVITVPANDLVGTIHDRMPAILDLDAAHNWLDPGTPLPYSLELLSPHPSNELEMFSEGIDPTPWARGKPANETLSLFEDFVTQDG